MKLFSEYIILEKQNVFTQKAKPILLKILGFLKIEEIINTYCEDDVKNKFSQIKKNCNDLLKLIKNKNTTLDDILNCDVNKLDKYVSLRKQDTYNSFISLYNDSLKSDIPNFIKELKKSTANESLNNSEDTLLLTDLKQQLETIKDVKFDDDNNLYNICKNLIDNFETFVQTIEDKEEKQKQVEEYNKKFKKYIEEIEKLNNSLQKDKPSEEKVNKEVKQTEQKVINSKYLKDLTDGIINADTREKFEELFYSLADDKIKEKPDNEQYLGLTIITISASILKQNEVDKQTIETYLDDIINKATA